MPDDVAAALRPATVLLIVPPFAWIDRPSLGLHLLQGLARRQGVEVQVLYANVLFAASIGERAYLPLSRTHYSLFLGERLFARAAFGTPPLGHDRGAPIDDIFAPARDEFARAGKPFVLTGARLAAIEASIPAWLEAIAPAIAARGYRAVGCSTSFEQTGAGLAILRAVKRLAPQTLTLLGGANCEGEMGDALAALAPDIDAIFSGESEQTFSRFLDALARGEPPARRYAGEPCTDLDALPTPDYADYYAQVRAFLPDSTLLQQARATYETSRGCWWGQKSHCTFCGLNAQGMTMRAKSADRAIAELQALLAHHPNREVALTDNIMPHGYFKTLVPRLAAEVPGVRLMYELKANLTLAQVRALTDAGIREAQPGIEALSTGLLQLMGKGTTCAQNVALLRYARICGMHLHWNLLAGFPGDERAFYEETLALLRLVPHLQPPSRLNRVVIDRFSPYHADAARHGIRELRAIAPYRAWLPADAPHDRIAYHFEGVFASEALASPELLAALDEEIRRWRRRWIDGTPPTLAIRPHGDAYELTDTRGLPGLPETQRIDHAQAVSALVARPLSAPERAGDAWARAHALVVERDRRLVPLALAPVPLLADLEAQFRPATQLRIAS
jgi:ribosomal peptide maturation radical SAM protein 1